MDIQSPPIYNRPRPPKLPRSRIPGLKPKRPKLRALNSPEIPRPLKVPSKPAPIKALPSVPGPPRPIKPYKVPGRLGQVRKPPKVKGTIRPTPL